MLDIEKLMKRWRASGKRRLSDVDAHALIDEVERWRRAATSLAVHVHCGYPVMPGSAEALAETAYPQWIAEAERWRRTAKWVARRLSDDPLAAVADAYDVAGEA